MTEIVLFHAHFPFAFITFKFSYMCLLCVEYITHIPSHLSLSLS